MYSRFLDTLDTLLSQLPAKSDIIIGANINSNIGTVDNTHSAKFCPALGPHGLKKCNKKGKSLLHVYLTHNLRIMNTFFETKANSPGHSTWTSNQPTNTGIADSHMLDIIVCSKSLHKHALNCCPTLDGLDSNHHAVQMDLNLTSIKYKVKKSMNRGDIDWRKICEEEEQRKLYNKYLLQFTSRKMPYNNFCKAVVHTGRETTVAIDPKCEGWYAASEHILAPAIQEKNQLRHRLHDRNSLNPEQLADIQSQLKAINKCNQGLVELAKARWYKNICRKIHDMKMDPRLAWENIPILTGGKMAHHKTNLNMSMHLENGKLASNAKENMSVFGAHFTKVLNNHRHVDHTVLDLIEQKPSLIAIDKPITFKEVKKSD
jgi:hypothetical protein